MGDLEIDQHLEFQRKSWAVQRLGRALFTLFVLAGLVGVFGGGGIAKKVMTDAAGIARLEYPRFVRAHAPVEMKIELAERARDTDEVSIAFSAPFAEAFQVEKVSPEPVAQRLGKDEHVYVFKHNGSGVAPITFELKARKMGSRSTTVRVLDETPVELKFFIFP